MTPPPSSSAPRRPILPILNLQGRRVPVLEAYDVSASTSQLQSLARLSAAVEDGRAGRQRESFGRLLLLDVGLSGQRRIDQSRDEETTAIYTDMRGLIANAQAGDRRSHFDAMRRYFVLAHRLLETPEGREQVPALLGEFRAFAQQYLTFLNQMEISPEERLQYIYFASGVINNVLGRTQSNEDSRTATAAELVPLGELLNSFLDAALDQHRQHILAHPTGESYTPIVREIQMRQALLTGDAGAARQRAQDLLHHLAAHPPGEPDPNRPETRRWDLQAARLLQNDPDFNRLIQSLDAASSVESAGVLLNGVTTELLVTISAGIDQVNGDSDSTITERYRPLSSALAILSLARPGATVSELLTNLADSSQQSTIRSEIEAAIAQSTDLSTSLDSARGDVSLNDWLARAQRSAAHVERLRAGAGTNLLTHLLEVSRINHPVQSLADILHQHPQLLTELGLSPTEINSPTHQRQAALELLHRGTLATSLLQAYQTRHPNLSLAGIIEILGDQHLAATRINATVGAVLDNFHTGLETRPDHEIAALHGVFQVLGQTTRISENVSLESRHTTHSRELATRMEGYGYRTSRAWGHMTSGSSLATMGIGMILSEAAPAALLYRAGSTGRLVARGIPLVQAGRVTWQATALTGIGTGLAMSLIGSGFSNIERANHGLDTHFWSDFGHGAAVNSVVFGGTLLFQRGFSRFLAPSAGRTRELGELGWGRSLGLHFGTALFGTGLSLASNATLRWAHGGRFDVSYEEVAESMMMLLAWETGSAGLRRIRSRYGLRPALEGRLPFEPHITRLPTRNPRFTRFSNWFNRGMGHIGNSFLTVLGEYRAQVVRDTTQRIIENNPQLAPLENVIAHRLAREEIAAPGSLDQYNDEFFQRFQLEITGEVGLPTLTFVNSGATRSAPRTYSQSVIRALREHLETCSANDVDYLPRYLPRTPYEIVQIRIDPQTRRIVSVGTHNFGETSGSIVLNATFDPQTRTLRLPPVHGETTVQTLDMGPMFEAHGSSPLPVIWVEALGQRFLGQRLNQATRALVNQLIGNLNRDTSIRLPINAENGQVMVPTSIEVMPPAGTRVLRMTARYNGEAQTLTIPAPRGQTGEYVIDMDTGIIEHVLPEGSRKTGKRRDNAPSEPNQIAAQGR